ncbi:uncharacterized protein LOC135463846 [Liolophura sinensis]|uniref:uncharacterized protein LOC135463846 n=1 Tax=Liolophura sinensis TaxID=3198878 RepID=UPI00315834F1
MAALQTILDCDSDVNCATYRHGLTPLHIATALDRKDMVQVLQKHGADQGQRDKDGWLSIHYASQSGFDRVARIFELLKVHPKINEVRMETMSLASLESYQSIGQSSYTGSYHSMCSSKPPPDLKRKYGRAFTQHRATQAAGTCGANCFLSPAIDEIFALFDRSKDGKISMAELTEVIQFLKIPATPAEIEAMVRAVDVNENGVVDYEEFLELINRNETDLSAPSSDLPGILFDIFDADGNGIIDRGEITRVMKNLGVTVNDEDLTEMLREADINGDGQIDKTEFEKLFENLKPSLP